MKRFIIILILLLPNYLVCAQAAPIHQPIKTIANTNQAKGNAQLASDMLFWLHKALSTKNKITQQEIDHFFAKNASYQFGNKILMHNDVDYWHEINSLASNTIAIKNRTHEIIAAGDKVVIWYDINTTLLNKQSVIMHIISIFTIQHHKITHWVKVVDSRLLYP